MQENSRWSEAADNLTRLDFDEWAFGMSANELHCKHTTGGFGVVRRSIAVAEDIVVIEKVACRQLVFQSVEAFIEAGWTID